MRSAPRAAGALLPRLATGEQFGCYALDRARRRLRHRRIRRAPSATATAGPHGTKTWITNGGFADAVIVFARTGGAGAGA